MAVAFLDANVWIAYLNIADTQHEKAQRVFKEVFVDENSVAISYSIVSEVYTVLHYRALAREAREFLSVMERHEQIELLFITREDFVRILEFIQNNEGLARRKFSLPDIEVLFFATLFPKWTFVTFDADLAKALKNLR